MVLAQFICERHGNVERKKRQKTERTSAIVDVYDETMYGDAAYNEALAADLFDFEDHAARTPNDRMFSFEDGRDKGLVEAIGHALEAEEVVVPVDPSGLRGHDRIPEPHVVVDSEAV